jgi:hypothetical protein
LIINHSSTVKEVSILKRDGADSKVQIKIYKEEINKLHDIFQKFKPELTYLYSLTPAAISILSGQRGEYRIQIRILILKAPPANRGLHLLNF